MKCGEINKDELQYGNKVIRQWYKNDNKTLSITTSPFNSNLIFKDIILNIINEKKKVLYVWGYNGEDVQLINNLKLEGQDISYSNINSGKGRTDITFVHYKYINKITGEYELAIVDDISNFSNINLHFVREVYEITSKLANRVITYAIDSISRTGDRVGLAPIKNDVPFVEPRILKTRIDLKKDIPYSLYDYIKWFKKSNKVVGVFVPNEDMVDSVFEYYTNVLKIHDSRIITLHESDRKKTMKTGLKFKDEAIFIITSYIGGNLDRLKMNDAIILFADDSTYDYKKLIYLCGELGRVNNNLPEILFVSRSITKDMDKAKDMSREYNKMRWEKRA